MSDDFDDQLVGVTPGDERSFTTTPKGTDEPADVDVKVSRVQELVLPELTDEWVAENLGEYDTVAAWTDGIRRRLAEAKLRPLAQRARRAHHRRAGQAHRRRAARGPGDRPTSAAASRDSPPARLPRHRHRAVPVRHRPGRQRLRRGPAPGVGAGRPARPRPACRRRRRTIDADDDDVDAEYQRIAVQTGQKAGRVRNAYEIAAPMPRSAPRSASRRRSTGCSTTSSSSTRPATPLDRDELPGHSHDDDHERETVDDDGDQPDVTTPPRSDEPAGGARAA